VVLEESKVDFGQKMRTILANVVMVLEVVSNGKKKYGSRDGPHYRGIKKMMIPNQQHCPHQRLKGLNEIIGATRAIEGSAYKITLVVSWMQTLGSQPVMPKISPITGTRCLPKP
jgi:hypothetical protein